MGLFSRTKNKDVKPVPEVSTVEESPTVAVSTAEEAPKVIYDDIRHTGEIGKMIRACFDQAGLTWLINGSGSARELYEDAAERLPGFTAFEPLPNGMAYVPSGDDQIFCAMFEVDSGTLLAMPVFNNPSADAFFGNAMVGLLTMKDRWNLDFTTLGGSVSAEVAQRLAHPKEIDLNQIIPAKDLPAHP